MHFIKYLQIFILIFISRTSTEKLSDKSTFICDKSESDQNSDNQVCLKKELPEKKKMIIYNYKDQFSLKVDEDLHKILLNVTEIRLDDEETPETEMPFIVDHFGYRHNWTDPKSHWTTTKRKDFYKNHKLIKAQPPWVPKFTTTGYKKMKMPEKLYKLLLENQKIGKIEPELCSSVTNCEETIKFSAREVSNDKEEMKNFIAYFPNRKTQVIHCKNDTEIGDQIKFHLKPILENWIGGEIPLVFSSAYGIRRYLNGSNLIMHVDRITSHIISAILQVDQDVVEDWPLAVIDHKKKRRKISLKPGEMILYESATVAHGKPYPFNGNFYDNVFIHFRPKIWYSGNDEFPLNPKLAPQKLTIDMIKSKKDNL